jgi:hypothetical protein
LLHSSPSISGGLFYQTETALSCSRYFDGSFIGVGRELTLPNRSPTFHPTKIDVLHDLESADRC